MFFKTLIDKINDLIGNSNECKISLDSIDRQVDSLKSDLTNFSLGVHTDGFLYIFHNGEPIGSGVSMPSGVTGDVISNVDSENTYR